MHTITAYHPDNDKSRRVPDWAASFDSGLLQSGDTFSHTFETPGVYDYFCSPHESMGMVGSVIVGDPAPEPDVEPGLASPQNDVAAPDAISALNDRAIVELGGSPTGTGTPTPTPTPSGSGTTVDVSIPAERFEPDLVHVQPGDTVRWTWNEDGHTVTAYHPTNNKPQRTPDGAASFGSSLGSTGDTFEHTFGTEGVYDYYCMPHESKGMVGSVIVGDPTDASAEPGLAAPQSSLPDEAQLAISGLNQRAKEELGLADGSSSGDGSSGGGIQACGSPEIQIDGVIQIDIDGEVCQGSTVTAIATLDGTPVANAEVSVNGDRVGTTDGDGQRSVTVPDGDRFRLEVAADGDEGEVRIRW